MASQRRPNWLQRLARLSRQQVQHGFLYAIAVIIVLAAIASCAHLIVAFSFANLPAMGAVLSAIIVGYNIMFFMLAIVRKDAPADMVEAVKAGFFFLAVVEWFGNMMASYLYVQRNFPPELSNFLWLPDEVLHPLVALLLGSFIPVISYFAMLALVAGGAGMLRDDQELLSKADALDEAERLLQEDADDDGTLVGVPRRR